MTTALPGIFAQFFVNIYNYREYFKQSVARDLRRRYKRSVLGYFWSMLNPLLMMTVLAVVFANIMRQNIEDYAVFLFCGILPYTYFASTSNACLGSIRNNARIMDQIAVPKYIFPISVGFSGLVDLAISFVPLFFVMIVVGRPIEWTVLAVPMVLLPLFCVTMGMALLIAVSNVFFEDTMHLTDVFFKALYFLCPILYSRDLLPDWLQDWVVLNPMFCIIEFMRDLFYHGRIPTMDVYLLNLFGSLCVLALGLWVFSKADKKFIYFL